MASTAMPVLGNVEGGEVTGRVAKEAMLQSTGDKGPCDRPGIIDRTEECRVAPRNAEGAEVAGGGAEKIRKARRVRAPQHRPGVVDRTDLCGGTAGRIKGGDVTGGIPQDPCGGPLNSEE